MTLLPRRLWWLLVVLSLLDRKGLLVVEGGRFWDDDTFLASTVRHIQQWSDPESTRTVRNETSIVPHQFIVRFSDTSSPQALSDDALERKAALVAKVTGGTILWIYRQAFQGVAIVVNSTMRSPTTATTTKTANATFHNQRLRAHKLGTMEEDRRFALDVIKLDNDTDRHRSGQRRNRRDLAFQFMTPNNTVIPIGLDRIDQDNMPLDGQYRYDWNGTGVIVFVLDSGLRTTHSEFDRHRATCGFDFYTNDPNRRCVDDFDHGTHVAGTIGGRRAGVAKDVTLVGVKVLDQNGEGSDAAVLAGIDYVLQQKRQHRDTAMVVNMSFGRLYSLRYNLAVRRLVRAGVVVVAAAGNVARNACLVSPGSAQSAITVGSFDYSALRKMETRSIFSNHGRCVDLFAPGDGITSAGAEDDINFATYSGTSMSTPHVTGAVALYLQRDPTMTPLQVRTALLNDALTGKLSTEDTKRSPNKVLYTGHL